MIISHQYRYLFVEIPHTASTAISHELCEYYGGQPILHKHAHLAEFFSYANADEKGYFIFAGIRNPLDVTVTQYFKLKTNHQQFYTTPMYWKRNGGFVPSRTLKKFQYINATNATFEEYFLRFFYFPYCDYVNMRYNNRFDFIIRYENLQSDFETVLTTLGIKPVRRLPKLNKTSEKTEDFWQYYTPKTRQRAVNVFGPYLQEWGYELPEDWNKISPRKFFFVLYGIEKIFKRAFYWRLYVRRQSQVVPK